MPPPGYPYDPLPPGVRPPPPVDAPGFAHARWFLTEYLPAHHARFAAQRGTWSADEDPSGASSPPQQPSRRAHGPGAGDSEERHRDAPPTLPSPLGMLRGRVLLAGDRAPKRRPIEVAAVLDTGFEGGLLLPQKLADVLGPVEGVRQAYSVVETGGAVIEGARGFVHVASKRHEGRARWHTVDAFFSARVSEVVLGARWLATVGGHVMIDGARWTPPSVVRAATRRTPLRIEDAADARRRLAALPPLRIGMELTPEDPDVVPRPLARLAATHLA